MPRTITVSDPRPRTREVFIDLTDPYRYRITIRREVVEEAQDGTVLSRSLVRTIVREVGFDRDTDTPSGDPLILAVLPAIREAIEGMEAADIAADVPGA